MNFRHLRLLGLAAAFALSSAPGYAQETAPAEETVAPAPPAEAATPAEPAAPAAPLKLSNKWRVEISEGANNAGTLLFRVTPDKGTPQDILVNIAKGRSENGVAQDVKNAFKAALDPKVFHVEVDDGEDVLVKRRKGPNFEVKFVESTLKGTRVNIKKE